MKIIFRHFSELVKRKDKVLKVSQETQASLEQSGFYATKPLSIDYSKNPVAYKIINTESLSVKDQDLKFSQIDISTMKNLELSKDYLQSELGDINIYGKNEILLEDVDPKNLGNKTIILWGKKAKLKAYGKIVEGEGEEGVGKVDKQIFYEEEVKHGVKLTWKHYGLAVLMLPVVFYLLIYLQVVREYLYVNSFYTALDRENKELLDTLKNIPRSVYKAQKNLEKMYPD
ncbi:unnamed protein product [Blepharisma stoltei]|uniref:Uncharacterized protein n=1 Tax=Blepharisma stoltei TaxID=1481888 RepID=A0AAU9K6T1_9CILI|nr:unnamed protein product [Blepharisma stoltei]